MRPSQTQHKTLRAETEYGAPRKRQATSSQTILFPTSSAGCGHAGSPSNGSLVVPARRTSSGAIRTRTFFQVNFSPQEAILTMNNSTIAARTDGCLQIEVEDPKTLGSRSFWPRQYYVVPLEVLIPSQSLIQAKRYYRETGKDKKVTGEITDLKNSVFAGQIFAEMLAGICHEEFYRYSDQEVPHPVYSIVHSHTVTYSGVRDFYYPYFFPIISRFILTDISPICPRPREDQRFRTSAVVVDSVV